MCPLRADVSVREFGTRNTIQAIVPGGLSVLSTETLRYRDAKFAIVTAAAYDETFPLAEIDGRPVNLFRPRIGVVGGEKQEQALDFEAVTRDEQFVDYFGA